MNAGEDIVRTGLEFLRPLWLAGVPLCALLAAYWWRRAATARSPWDAVVDPELRPYVIEGAGNGGAHRRARGPLALCAGWALACVLLSGPVFERRQVEVHAAPGAEVVLLDLSRSMRADDLRPDRITRARYKLDELLARDAVEPVRGAEEPGADVVEDPLSIGLVAFAERPYTVSPLTDDAATVRAFLPSLVPEIAPVQGSRIDLAIERGAELLERGRADAPDGIAGGAARPAGHLLLVTDGVPDEAAVAAARRARNLGHRLSVLGVGTAAGAPLADAEGRFLTDADGGIVVPRLELPALQRLAAAGGGTAVALTDDDRDLDALSAVRDGLDGAPRDAEGDGRPTRRALWWIERSPWGVPLLAAGALWQFRRRVSA